MSLRTFDRRTREAALALWGIACAEQPITLRGLFYRAVSAGVYPDTSQRHYEQCGGIVLKVRRTGLLPYAWIVDSTRRRLKPSSWSGLDDYAETVANCYRRDLWARQKDYIEFFVEKDAMAAVIEPLTAEYDVHLNVIRGSVSETFAWNIAVQWNEIEKPITGYYLGDHDPSGLQIEENLESKAPGAPGFTRLNWDLRPTKDVSIDYGGDDPKRLLPAGDYTAELSFWIAKNETKLSRRSRRGHHAALAGIRFLFAAASQDRFFVCRNSLGPLKGQSNALTNPNA